MSRVPPVDIYRLLDEVGPRLKEVREADPRYRSVRRWAAFLRSRTGYEIAHRTILNYETGASAVPAGYVLAVALASQTNPIYLLTGWGNPVWTVLDEEATLAAGIAFLKTLLARLERAAAPRGVQRMEPPHELVAELGSALDRIFEDGSEKASRRWSG